MSGILTSTYVERDGLLWSPLLGSIGLVAGFTTKAQGSMAGSHHPLEEQAANRAALARRLGFTSVARVKQVHGRDVVHVENAVEPGGGSPRVAGESSVPIADAMWTDAPGRLLGVAAADCVPVLVADPRGPIGAAHAGWQGTSLAVATALVEALVAAGAERARLVASIGPSIGPCCYAIDKERAALIRERIGGDALVESDDRVIFDLWHANEAQLRAAGVEHIEVAGVCTRSSGAPVWSYRARGADGKYGTQLGFIGRPVARA